MDEDPESSPAASPPPTTTEPSPTEAHIEKLEDKDEPKEQTTPAASPKDAVDLMPESSPAAHSPGLSSGTKEDEVQVTGTQQVPVQNTPETLAKVPAPDADPATPAKNKNPASSSNSPSLDTMSVPALCDEYFSRLAQHKTLETELVILIQKRYQVPTFTSCRHIFLHNYTLSSPQALSSSLVMSLALITCIPWIKTSNL